MAIDVVHSSLLAEYDDCVQRADRLAEARDAYLNGDPVKVGIIKEEDVAIFLRDSVLKQQSWKKVTALLTVSIFHLFSCHFFLFELLPKR